MKQRNKRLASSVIVAAVTGILPALSSANVTYTWNGNTSSGFGTFAQSDNWVNGVAPLTSGPDDIVFGSLNSHSYQPTAGTAYNINSFSFNSSSIAWTGGLAITGQTLSIGAGGLNDAATNTETILNPIILTANQPWNSAGGSFSATNTVNVGTFTLSASTSVAAASLNFSGALSGTGTISKTGVGSLGFAGGGTVGALNLQGGLTTNSGGTLGLTTTTNNPLAVTNGTFNITGGVINTATPSSSFQSVLIDSSGSVLVTGTGSQLNANQANGSIVLGINGAGAGLTIANHGAVNTIATFVGDGAGSDSLTVNTAGQFTTSFLYIGASSAGSGIATVTGTGSLATVTGQVAIGGYLAGAGTGTLSVAGGGVVNASSIGFYTSASLLSINGGTVTTPTLADNGSTTGSVSLLADPAGGYALNLNGSTGGTGFAGVISGPGSLNVSGGSTVTLNGADTGTGTLIVGGGGTVVLTNTNTFSHVNIGSGTVTMSGSGALTASTALNFNGGTLNANGSATSIAGSINSTGGGGTIQVPTSSVLNFSGTLNGTGTSPLNKTGPGTLNLALSGTNNAYTFSSQAGVTQVSSGTVTFTNTSGGDGLDVNSSVFNISGGSKVIGSGNFDVTIDNSSSALVTGTGSQLNGSSNEMYINGGGTLTVSNSGAVNAATFLVAGIYNGTGTLTINTHGTVNAPVTLAGLFGGSTGFISVDGAGSTLNAVSFIDIGGDGFVGGTGTLSISNAGSVVTPNTGFDSGPSSINVSGGTLNTGGLASLNTGFGSVSISDPVGGVALNINGSSGTPSTYSGSISGTGSINKSGGSTQILAGANTFTGQVLVTGGALNMTTGAASYYEVDSGSLALGFAGLGSAAVVANASGTVTFTSPTVTGGYLEGLGTYNVSAVSKFIGTNIENGTTLTPALYCNLNAVTSSGTVNVPTGNTISWNGGSNAGGRLNISGGSAYITEWTSSGIIQVLGSFANLYVTGGTNLLLLGGSRTYVGSSSNPTGFIDLSSGETVELNGGLLVNYGTISGGTVDVNYGGLATGTGSYPTVVVTGGGTYLPGAFSAASPAIPAGSPDALIEPAASGSTTTGTSVVADGDLVITVNNTDHLTLTSPLTAAGHNVTKTGTGTVTVLPFAATSLNVSAGTVQLSPSTTPLQVSGLTVTPGGTLDLTSDAADVGTSSLSSITTLLQQGYNNGHWTGTGIISSTAAADSKHLTAVGVIQNNQSGSALFSAGHMFHGVTPNPSDVLLAYTYVGDANLDGKVDGSDYSLIDAGYSSHGSKTGWYYGDFNYDGVVDGSDYALIDNAFNNQSAPINPTALVASSTGQVAGTAAVPEPGAAGVVAMVAVALGRRRRRIKTA
jgi:fibronectin-binding autotransporter adhesin